MSIPVVKDFTRKINDKHLTKGLPPVKKTLSRCLIDLQTYIESTIHSYLGTVTYDNTKIAEWIFKETYTAAEKEEYVKISLYAARQTLTNLINEIKGSTGKLTRQRIKLYEHLLRDFLHDIAPFIDHYMHKTKPTYRFLTGGKNYSTSSFETFMVARNMFYGSLTKANPFHYKESQGMVAMTLRQSMEIKTKRILGINKINKVGKKVPDYGFKRLFEFIEANAYDIEYNPINFEIYKVIYKWSCGYIHNGEISYLWQTEFALRSLKPFFATGKHSTGGRTIHSVYGAFKLKNYTALKARLNTFVGPNYAIEYLPAHLVESIIVS